MLQAGFAGRVLLDPQNSAPGIGFRRGRIGFDEDIQRESGRSCGEHGICTALIRRREQPRLVERRVDVERTYPGTCQIAGCGLGREAMAALLSSVALNAACSPRGAGRSRRN